ncbi:MAG: ABC transporter ATP-binding protein [Flavobacteriales bacterium]
MAFLDIKNITKSYKSETEVLKGVSFSVQQGTLTALLGESGSGKSTLLRTIAGFEIPEQGRIILNNTVLVDESNFVKPEKRKIVVVFQDFALFPHLTVCENILFGMSSLIGDKTKELADLLSIVGLKGFGQRYPHQLSGGQQQRVALARALAAKPDLLLLDEPFSNLDQSVKEMVRTELAVLLKSTGVTTIMVTHDIADCLAIADQVMVLERGIIVQHAFPHVLYQNPINEYVARLFGEINILSENEGLRLEAIQIGKGEKKGIVAGLKKLGRENKVELNYFGNTLVAYTHEEFIVGQQVSFDWDKSAIIQFGK